MASLKKDTAYYHLPGLFEFYELYRVFLPLFYEHREYFYDWCEIGSIYGARTPAHRRTASGEADASGSGITTLRRFWRCCGSTESLPGSPSATLCFGRSIFRIGNVMLCASCLRKVGIKETV